MPLPTPQFFSPKRPMHLHEMLLCSPNPHPRVKFRRGSIQQQEMMFGFTTVWWWGISQRPTAGKRWPEVGGKNRMGVGDQPLTLTGRIRQKTHEEHYKKVKVLVHYLIEMWQNGPAIRELYTCRTKKKLTTARGRTKLSPHRAAPRLPA